MKLRKVLALVTVMLTSLHAQSQTCLSDFTSSATDYTDNADGTVTNNVLGLTWMSCSLGQTWEDDTCSGDGDELTWQQALVAAHGYEYADSTAWRLPNIKELASLNERGCVLPAINETLFPETYSDDYWTSTPSVTDPERAWVIAFYNSSNALKDKSLTVFVRLVRSSE